MPQNLRIFSLSFHFMKIENNESSNHRIFTFSNTAFNYVYQPKQKKRQLQAVRSIFLNEFL